MTGFGAASAPWVSADGAFQVEVELRSLNARFLEVKLRHPFGMEVEQMLRRTIESRIGRGRVDVGIFLRREAHSSGDGAALSGFGLDEERVRDALAALARVEHIARDVKLEVSPPNSADILRFLTSITRSSNDAKTDPPPCLEALLDEALDQLCAFREKEGAHLAEVLSTLMAELADGVVRLRALLPQEQHRLHERLRERLTALIERTPESQAALDPDRLAQEVALAVARSDIAEELARIESHLLQVRQLLAGTAKKGQGKTLDFLSQELMREVTTIGSKITSHEGSAVVIEAKGIVERMREQVQNVE